MGAPPDDHHCEWREEAIALRVTVGELRTQVAVLEGKLSAVLVAMEALERRVLGPKSEKMPPAESEIRRQDDDEEDAEARRLAALRRRRERGALRDQLRRQTVQHHLTADEKECPRCGAAVDRPLPGKETVLYEYVPGYFVKQVAGSTSRLRHRLDVPLRVATTAPASSPTLS